MNSSKRNLSGFTLVEIMVVVVVLVIIASISVVGYSAQQKMTRDNALETSGAQLAAALDSYYEENGNYPVTCDIGTNATLACSNLTNTYTGSMVQPPTITASTTTSALRNILRQLPEKFSHAKNNATTVINQQASGAIKTDSYFLLSMDMVPGADTTATSASVTFQTANASTFTCGFTLTGYNPANVEDIRPHQYVIGLFSENDSAWKFFISSPREDQNVLTWNTAPDARCAAKTIGDLKNASSS